MVEDQDVALAVVVVGADRQGLVVVFDRRLRVAGEAIRDAQLVECFCQAQLVVRRLELRDRLVQVVEGGREITGFPVRDPGTEQSRREMVLCVVPVADGNGFVVRRSLGRRPAQLSSELPMLKYAIASSGSSPSCR